MPLASSISTQIAAPSGSVFLACFHFAIKRDGCAIARDICLAQRVRCAYFFAMLVILLGIVLGVIVIFVRFVLLMIVKSNEWKKSLCESC